MQTKPNPINPELLDFLLRALLEEDATLPAIAREMQVTIADLLAFIELPGVQQSLARLRTALTQRAEIVALSSETAALQNLATVSKDLDDIAEERRTIEEEAAAADPADKAATADIARARTLNTQRMKDRLESARASRAALAHARKRTTRAHDALPSALKLTMPIEEFEQTA